MDEAGAAIRFLNDHPELNRLGVQVEFDANASQEAADVVIDYQREISTCDGETANTSYIYCSHYLTDRDDLRGDYTILIIEHDIDLDLPAATRRARVASTVGLEGSVLAAGELTGQYGADQGTVFVTEGPRGLRP